MGKGEDVMGRGGAGAPPRRGGIGVSWLDVKLGFRMLVKYPVLSLVGGIAITVAAGIGVAGAEFMHDALTPDLPLDDPDRVVRLVWVGVDESLYDYALWRGEIESVVDIGAATQMELGLVAANGTVGAANVAQMTASAFRVSRVGALLGRVLTEADEQEGAPAVVVLGYGPWQTLFDGDPAVLGQVVQLGGSPTTVVGVMPEGYGFPVNHDAWTPLRFNRVEATRGSGPPAMIFGRLADGVSLEMANAELSALSTRETSPEPQTGPQLTTQVVEYGSLMSGSEMEVVLAYYGVRLLFVFLLVVACANVATLVFARAVNREAEIALRTALGATRRRIVFQFFVEALVLVSVATTLALVITDGALEAGSDLFWEIQQVPASPFWWDGGLSLETILFAAVLAFVGAVMIGVVPALKATNGRLQPRLSQLSTGSGGTLRFGGIWTAVIVFQVALSVAFLPIAVQQALVVVENPLAASAFPATEYLTGRVARDVAAPPSAASETERAEQLETTRQLFDGVKRAVAAEDGVQGVAFASTLSGLNHPVVDIEVRGDGGAPPVGGGTRVLGVDQDYLRVMGSTAVSGRALLPADFAEGARFVVVNQAFVERVLQGVNAVGAQVRFPGRDGEDANLWYEIVGVVSDPEMDDFGGGVHSAIYEPLAASLGAQLFVQLRPDAGSVSQRLHEVVRSVSPSVRLEALATVEDAWSPVHRGERLFGWIFALAAGVTLMLSVAGIYALMSFTVSQRTREIAIRAAVGAAPRSIVMGIFRRAFLQLALGVAVGMLVAGRVIWDEMEDGPELLLIVAALLLSAGLASCFVPIHRALHIHPSHAIKTG